MSERYYVNSPIADQVILQGAEARHLAVVCRLRPGDAVYLFNGDGNEYRAEIAFADKKRVELNVTERTSPARELPFSLEVASPLPKGDRGQFLIEKLTELGVTSFTPLRTARSVVHPSEGRTEKLERYVIEASKQCGRNVLMRISPLQAVEEYLRRTELPSTRLMADPSGQALGIPPVMRDAAIAIGPEGGFTSEELEAARSNGWQIVSFGPRILRVETAALALAAMIARS
jgi:16S rRNA (uracil1498-N3)-methyltransferase